MSSQITNTLSSLVYKNSELDVAILAFKDFLTTFVECHIESSEDRVEYDSIHAALDSSQFLILLWIQQKLIPSREDNFETLIQQLSASFNLDSEKYFKKNDFIKLKSLLRKLLFKLTDCL